MIQSMLNSIITDTLKIGALKDVTKRQQETTKAVNTTTEAVAETLPEDKKQEIKSRLPSVSEIENKNRDAIAIWHNPVKLSGSQVKASGSPVKVSGSSVATEVRNHILQREAEDFKLRAFDSISKKYEEKKKQSDTFKKNVNAMKGLLTEDEIGGDN